MFSHHKLLEIISGRQKGILSSVTRSVLGCMTPLYRTGVWWRNRNYNRAVDNPEVIKRAGVPVISVGNLTTGGTGKTPMVIWISKWLRSQNQRVALISRGYTADLNSSHSRNDEAIELENRLADVPHLQDPDRFAMTQIAVSELESQVIVLDDGFQHRKLWRDLDIVLIDATEPFGFGRLLPRGLLREPINSLSRADIAIVTRANLVPTENQNLILNRIKQANPQLPIALTQTVFTTLLQFDGTQIPVERLNDFSSVFVFCAIGNPQGFQSSLEEAGAKPSGLRTFRDHHEFTREELEQVGAQAQQSGAQAIVCTHKDLVKVGTNRLGGLPVYATLIDVEFVAGENLLTSKLQQVVELIETEDNCQEPS